MRLKARKKRSKYRTDLEYIRSVYQSNKSKIIKNMAYEWLGKRYEPEGLDRTIASREGRKKAEEAVAFYEMNPKKMSLEEQIAWKENKKELEKKAYQTFKSLIEDQMRYTDPNTKEGYTVERAILRESRSKDLNKKWDTADVYARNFHEKIKMYDDGRLREEFYEYENIKRIDYSQYQFMGYYSYKDPQNGGNYVVYRYNNSYFLEGQSPKGKQNGNFIFMKREEFENKLELGIIEFSVFRKRS